MMTCVLGLSGAVRCRLAGSGSPGRAMRVCGERFRGLSDLPAYKRIRSPWPRRRKLQRDRVLLTAVTTTRADIYSPPKTVSCQPLWASPVMSGMTGLMLVYSSTKYVDLSLPLCRIRRLCSRRGHLADDRDVVVDPYAAPGSHGGALAAEHVCFPRRGCQSVESVVGQLEGFVFDVER